MVFESIVVELINRYLGDFVENLDTSQLKIGIWGGDVVLHELDLKESALDELDLPVKVKAGHVGTLTLKIPWKNLYKEPVIATIDGLYALAVPNVGIKYNAEKEEKQLQEAKQKKLLALEEAKKLEAEKDKPKEKKKDSFAEKLATQVIKNLQIEIRNIHVRFEDQYTNPKQPFSIGVTLKELLFRTTDEFWKPCIIKDAVTQIYKLVKLESLAVYWNSQTEQLGDLDKADILKSLKSVMAPDSKPSFQYLIKPISSVAHLKLNTKPEEHEFKIPKVSLTIIFDDISIGLAKLQYNDVLEMLEGFERVNLMGIYRKYKPVDLLPFKKNISKWWKFAYTCILEGTVRRRRKMWSWNYIKLHRDTKRKYREAYISKLEKKKVSKDLQQELDDCEKLLDIFNITILRQQAEVESAKRGAKKAEEKKNAGWFGGWFGSGKKEDDDKKKSAGKEIQEQFYEQFTSEEKNKLYDAIGYQENEADPTLPKEFVAIRLVLKLNNLSVSLSDKKLKDAQILKLQLKNVYSSIGQRPAANAVRVEAKMDKFIMLGTQQGELIPKMVSSPIPEGTQQVYSLLDLLFETNPLDGLCDTRLRVNTRPVQVIYDAITVNQMAEFFKPPRDIQLKQLSQAAMSKYEEIKEQSATGLQHAIDLKKYTEIAVDVQSSYVIVPHGGILRKQKDVAKLVLDLGNFKVSTEKNQSDDSMKGQAMSLEEVMLKAYDKFNINLDKIQLLMAHPGEDWQAARKLDDSKLHILSPISISVVLQKCMFDNDPRMAKMKVKGELPLLSLTISDHRLQEILSLVQSIPLPEGGPPEPESEITAGPSALPTVDVTESRLAEKASSMLGQEETNKKAMVRTESQEYLNVTDMELVFVLKKINVNICQRSNKEDVPLLKLVIDNLGTDFKMRTFDMIGGVYLGGIYLQYLKVKETESGPLINLVNTPATGDEHFKLLKVSYLKANTDGPEFASIYKNTEQTIGIEFAGLELLLHLECILDLMEFANSIQPPKLKALEEKSSEVKTDDEKMKEEKGKVVKKKKMTKSLDIIDLKLDAALKMFQIKLCSHDKLLTDIKIKGIDASVTLQERKTVVSTVLKDISVRDPDTQTFYPNIIEIQGKEVLALNLTLYNNNTEGEKYEDMSCVDMKVVLTLGRIKVTFLNKYVMTMLGFLDHFQAAQAKLKEAGDAMAEITQDAVQNLQETASRLSLSVDMNAPLIFVPQSSKSLTVLMVDLGNLSVKNRFEMPGKRSQNGIPAVLEKMSVKLTDLKISRASVDASQLVLSEVEILQPMSLTLDLARNIAASWFHDVPDIDLQGTLEAVKVTLSQGDFTTLMKVLDENLTEGQEPANKTSQTQVPAIEAGSSKTETAITPSKTAAVEASPGSEKSSQQVWCKLKFNFCVNSLSATLYKGDSDLKSGLCTRNPEKSLGSFELQLIALSGKMMSNNNMDVKIILKDTIMDDLRFQKKDGITRMMERSKKISTLAGQETNMIDVSFEQVAADKTIEVHMSSLYLCVCLDFLMALADFFVKGLPDKPDSVTPEPSDTKKVTKAKEEKSTPQEGGSVPPEGEMTVKVKIDKPEIILIEDQSNLSSGALILDTELLFSMRQSPETMDMSASISHLGIVSCKFDDRTTPSQILSPCEISFYGKTPKDQGAHMDVSTSDLILNISPATIRVMSAIAAGLSKQEENEEEEDKISENLWQIRSLADCNYWFLKTDDGTELDLDTPVVEDTEGSQEQGETREEMDKKDRMIVKVPTIVVKIEGGVGKRTVPLLVTEMSFAGQVRDWSNKLYVESSLKLEVAYYNEKLSTWEPLLEPVLDQNKFRPWELQLEVMKNDDVDLDFDDEEETDMIRMPPPKMSINLKSIDALQVTMTKSCLECLNHLGQAFGDAYRLVEPMEKAGEILDPFVIKNVTGVDLTLKLDPSFEMPSDASMGKVLLKSDQALGLQDKQGKILRRQKSMMKAQDADEKKIIFQAEKFDAAEVTIKRTEQRLFHVSSKDGEQWAVVCETSSSVGQKTISFKSSVKVTNHLMVPVEVFYMDNSTGVTPITVVKSEDDFSLPIRTIYTKSKSFMFRPLKEGCTGISEEVSWKGAENMGIKQVSCKGEAGLENFYLKVRAQIETIFYMSGDVPSAKTTTFHIYPTVILHNLLPYKIAVLVEGTADTLPMESGTNTPLDHVALGKSTVEITIPDYQGKEWVGRRQMAVDIPELSVWSFEAFEGGKKITLDLGLHYKQGSGTLEASIFSPYWMINKTSLGLVYKAGDDEPVQHPGSFTDIVMFSFKQGSFFGKKKATLKIGDGDWSDKFSLDTVGSSGTVQSKTKTRTWEVGVDIILSSSGLTKIVTFTPYYMLVNTSKHTMMVKEVSGESDWIEISEKQCVPIWPLQTGKEMVMQARMKDSETTTGSFLFNQSHTTLLKLDNKYGGINVECQETESAMVTTLNHYKDGMATVLIINHTDRCDLTYNQSGVKDKHVLKPETCCLYTWENSLGKREFIWTCGQKKEQKNDLSQDGIGELFFDNDTKVYWVSFLDGMQRVLLFTLDLALATMAQEAGELERIEQEITLNIRGMGLSLVNNDKQEEVAFLGITSSGIIWEEKKKRYKAFNVKTCQALETAYQKFELERASGRSPPEKLSVEKMEINFQDMVMLKPGKRSIRRSFQEGIWLQYKTSPHQVQFHAKINRVQLDNQVSGCVFPTVLSPIPPPKSVAADSVPKPFTEISLMMRKHEHSNVSQVKYFKVLIQEMQVKVDQGFLNNIIELFSGDQEITREQKKLMFDSDVDKTKTDLVTTMGLSLAQEQKMFYDYLHLSPIKIHLSFSLQGGGGGDGKPTQLKSNVINIFLQSVGVVLTDVQDVIFKLGYFERKHTFYNNKQLMGEMTVHYAGQAIKQMYVLVLGLDVLGNPFGLLRGMGEGLQDLFYEPYQGAIQGPGEFAEGLALGVRSLFGHAVGGAAGAVSRITGTLGKGIAALTLDDDYQKKRREQLNKRPANVGEGFARGGKGLVMGVFDGVTGIVRKPIEGAKKEGVEGFFKGVGKGLVGVVTRPTSGVIDFASSSFEGIKRIAENTSEIHRLRPPRRFHKDHVIRPYNGQEAAGYEILLETEKGRFYQTDDYVAHVVVTKDGKNVFLVTNKRVIFASRGEIFGSWNCEFSYTWVELKDKPKTTAKGVEIVLKEKEKRFLIGSFSKKEIHIADKKIAEWIVSKIADAMTAAGTTQK